MITKLKVFFFGLFITRVLGEIKENTLNSDGSFAFRHTNGDIGSYYHYASGSRDNIVRGRYGSRNPSNGLVEEVVYTAGPRGFRANGPKIHRKTDLAQYPRTTSGLPGDPLADPYDDPTYSFKFQDPEYSRSEDNDATGFVRGVYSFIDDVGDRHNVRYAAGAGTGFEVSNSVPYNPAIVAFSSPLYKAHPKTRGKSSVQRGRNGRYKFIAAAPDHRRAESSDSDGVVRGSYSYLDDKGVQRTVEYIAGAGIGYRIVHNSIGPGTHINPSLSAFQLSDTSFQLSSDFDTESRAQKNSEKGFSDGSNDNEYLQTAGSGRMRLKNDDDKVGTGKDADHKDENNQPAINKQNVLNKSRGRTRYKASNVDHLDEDTVVKDNDKNLKENRKHSSKTTFGGGNEGGKKSDDNYNFGEDDFSSIPPLITSNRKLLEIGRERDWVERNRDSTIIKNVGNWYVGLLPGASVRAHVQSINIVPLGGRVVPSPSEALRRDELAESMSLSQ